MRYLIFLVPVLLGGCSLNTACRSERLGVAMANLDTFAEQLQSCRAPREDCNAAYGLALTGAAYNLHVINESPIPNGEAAKHLCSTLSVFPEALARSPIDASLVNSLASFASDRMKCAQHQRL